jgi:hypothetical protein
MIVVPAEAGIQFLVPYRKRMRLWRRWQNWIPAFAGTTMYM